MRVPTANLARQHEPLEGELMAALSAVLRSSAFCLGPHVEAFETSWAAYCGVPHALGVQSGTAALMAALVGVGVGPDAEVITTPATFVATVGAIHALGARPRFVDVDPDTHTLDPRQLAAAITRDTRAVVPVHLYGLCCDMDPIVQVCREHRIPVVEDASQAHGARYDGRVAGSLGDAAAFSFYPGKNLGALGEAGIVTTSNPDIARRVAMYRSHGEHQRYEHSIPGLNLRMTGMQGAALSVKLPHLEAWNQRRREVADHYRVLLEGLPLHLPEVPAKRDHVYHQFVVRSTRRDALRRFLAEQGVTTGVHYPTPVHLTPAYAFLGHQRGDFPNAETLSDTATSLPVYPEIDDDAVRYVGEQIQRFFAEDD